MTFRFPLSSLNPFHSGCLVGAFLSAAFTLITVDTTSAQTGYTVTELPLPTGYVDAAPYGINDQGFVVGCATSGIDHNPTAVTWKNGVAVLGRLKNGTYSVAMAMNSKGVVVGDGDDGDGRPLGWATSGSNVVNFFSNNGGNTRPIAINDLGEIGGYYVKGFDTSAWRGAIWKVDAKDPRKSIKTDLPLLPGGDPTTASAIPWSFNKKSEAAGWAANNVIGQHAAFWKSDSSHTIVDLGVFGSDWSSIASSLNDLGQVVGESHPPFSSRAVLWQNDAAHTAWELPLLPGDNYGSATLINNQGVILGWSALSEPGTWNVQGSRIVIWINGTPRALQSMLLPTSGNWTVVNVMSINNLGQMAALATRDGVTKAVVLTPAY